MPNLRAGWFLQPNEMPEPAAAAQSVLAELGYVLFLPEETGGLRLSGKPPGWLAPLWTHLPNDGLLSVAEASPFLENFLIDAAECWKKGGAARAQSGPWVEQDRHGAEVQLEATAMTIEGEPILLLERLGAAFEAKKSVLQRARETVIAHQRLNSEIQKKEILLHCVADEMTAALANVITSLRLIELEDNGPRTKLLLGLATQATHEQQTLIHRILGVFEEELRNAYDASADTQAGTKWNGILQRALDFARPLFDEKRVRLEAPAPLASEVRIPITPTHFERVLTNLLENALERSPADGAVVVRANEEPESLLVTVEDEGQMLAPKVCENLFARWEPARAAASPAAALRLHFCRIVVENCGGEIGCSPLSAGGNRFWVRLTKSNRAG
ncbi:MAG TPA: HAMP domain-containing sensor histidine kinase [Chthoniobacterales bacterium]